MDVMHSHSVLLVLACLCWWDRWIREARAGTITLCRTNHPAAGHGREDLEGSREKEPLEKALVQL